MRYLGCILYWGMVALLLLFLFNVLSSCTIVKGNAKGTAVWCNGQVIGAFTDGYICYGDADRVACHVAIAKPTYREIR